jgi:molybdopterin/thiamine biosynthesis adenylyltransferase
MREKHGQLVVVVGLGAIGSSVVLPLARLPEITHITLVDPDTYQESNLRSQQIFRCDVGQSKVAVQARRLRTVNPRLEVTAIPMRIEDVPLGLLGADLILACVDSRRARQSINEMAWRLGTTWIDSGVLGSALLARVQAYAPSPDAPCLECAWSNEDYQNLEAEYPCGAATGEHHSDSSSALGCLAASLLVIECEKFLRGDRESAALGRDVVINARTHRLYSSIYRRNSFCRFDHETWQILPLRCAPPTFTVAQALAITGRVIVAGHRFARALVCVRCGLRQVGLRLTRPSARCTKCGGRMVTPDYEVLEQLDATLPQEYLGRTLAQVGIGPGDVLSGGDKHYKIMPEVVV